MKCGGTHLAADDEAPPEADAPMHDVSPPSWMVTCKSETSSSVYTNAPTGGANGTHSIGVVGLARAVGDGEGHLRSGTVSVEAVGQPNAGTQRTEVPAGWLTCHEYEVESTPFWMVSRV